MGNSTLLQIFLLFDAFVMGIVVSVAARHAYSHFHPQKDKKPQTNINEVKIPREIREQLLEKAVSDFQKILNHSAKDLQDSLDGTTGQLNKQLEKISSEVIDDETKKYKQTIDTLRQDTENVLRDAQATVEEHQKDIDLKLNEKKATLNSQLEEKIKSQQQIILQNIDTKLADAVMSFLVEAMQHNIDLGTQGDYLISTLEQHKDELKKEITDEA